MDRRANPRPALQHVAGTASLLVRSVTLACLLVLVWALKLDTTVVVVLVAAVFGIHLLPSYAIRVIDNESSAREPSSDATPNGRRLPMSEGDQARRRPL